MLTLILLGMAVPVAGMLWMLKRRLLGPDGVQREHALDPHATRLVRNPQPLVAMLHTVARELGFDLRITGLSHTLGGDYRTHGVALEHTSFGGSSGLTGCVLRIEVLALSAPEITVEKRGIDGEPLAIGDRELDAWFMLRGPPARCSALMNQRTRAMLIAAGDISVQNGAIVQRISYTPDAMQHMLWPRTLKEKLDALIDIDEALTLAPDAIAERLCESVLDDPEPGVRLRCLEMLWAEYPASDAEQRATRAAVEDCDPSLRRRAILHVGGGEADAAHAELAGRISLAADSATAGALSVPTDVEGALSLEESE